MRMSPPITLRELARFLGHDFTRNDLKRLRRRIRNREEILGVQILMGNGDSNAPHTTTIPILREYMPEIFDRKNEGIDFIKAELAKYEERFDELKGRDQALARKLRALEAKLTP